MLQYRLYGGGHLPTNLEGFVKAGANIGSVIGQFAFGKRIPKWNSHSLHISTHRHRQTQDTRPTHLVARLFVRQFHIVSSTTDESL